MAEKTVWKAPKLVIEGAMEDAMGHYDGACIEQQAKIVAAISVNDTENYAMAYALLKFMQEGYFASFADSGASIDLRSARRYILAFNCACELGGVPHRRLG